MSDTLSPALLFALGLFAALWLLAGLWATLRGIAMQRRSAFVAGQAERLASLVEASPQLPVIVRADWRRSEEHTSELQSLMRISYAVLCLKNTTNQHNIGTQLQGNGAR